MKKSILKRISLALVLVFAAASFAGCGNGGVSSSTGNGSDNTAAQWKTTLFWRDGAIKSY